MADIFEQVEEVRKWSDAWLPEFVSRRADWLTCLQLRDEAIAELDFGRAERHREEARLAKNLLWNYICSILPEKYPVAEDDSLVLRLFSSFATLLSAFDLLKAMRHDMLLESNAYNTGYADGHKAGREEGREEWRMELQGYLAAEPL